MAVIPVEYSATGMIPTDWFIAELMQFLDLPYYVGVLSAAALHGAAHQQAQEFHVVVPRSERPIRQPAVTIHFFRHGAMKTTPTESIKGYRGCCPSRHRRRPRSTWCVSRRASAVWTRCSRCSPNSRKSSRRKMCSPPQKAESEVAQVQRMGWLLKRAGCPKIAEPLAEWLAARPRHKVRLDPRRPALGARKDARWQVIANADPQSEV